MCMYVCVYACMCVCKPRIQGSSLDGPLSGFDSKGPDSPFLIADFDSRDTRDVRLGLVQRSSSHASGYDRGIPAHCV